MYIYPNLPTNVIVRLPHPPSGDNQGKNSHPLLTSEVNPLKPSNCHI